MRSLRLAASCAVLAVAFGGCGTSDDSGTQDGGSAATGPAPVKHESRCLSVPAAARSALANGLKGSRHLGKGAAVESRGSFAGFRDLEKGVYFVTYDVKPSPGLATWAFGAESFKTGGDIIIAVDPAARAVTDFGADLPEGFASLDRYADGFSESVKCAG